MKGAAMLRCLPLDRIKEFCLAGQPNAYINSMQSRAYNHREEFLEFVNFLEPYNSTLWSKRIAGDVIDLYTNDKDFYESASQQFKNQLRHRFEPNGNIDLLNETRTIVGKKLPHGKYQYRVYLLPHKLAGDTASKKLYVEWVKKQDPKITCTKAVEKWFMDTEWNWDRRYVLVDNEQTLLMLKLRNAEVVGRVYKYVVTDK